MAKQIRRMKSEFELSSTGFILALTTTERELLRWMASRYGQTESNYLRIIISKSLTADGVLLDENEFRMRNKGNRTERKATVK